MVNPDILVNFGHLGPFLAIFSNFGPFYPICTYRVQQIADAAAIDSLWKFQLKAEKLNLCVILFSRLNPKMLND